MIAGGWIVGADSYPLSKNIDNITIASEGNAMILVHCYSTTRDLLHSMELKTLVRGLIAGGSSLQAHINIEVYLQYLSQQEAMLKILVI